MTGTLIAAMIAAFTAPAIAADAPKEAAKPNYFPHAKGSKWEYLRTFGTSVKMIEVQVVVSAKYTHQEVVTFNPEGEYLGFKKDMQVSAEGIFFPLAPDQTGKPAALLPSDLKTNRDWDSLLPAGCGFSKAKAIVNGPEELEVPAGKFRTLKVTYTGKIINNTVSMSVWYADGVGVVKQIFDPEGSNIIIELTKYTPGQ